jgi:hypothetical protein
MLSDDENQKGLWYPDEEICRLKKNLPIWVKQQKKIVKKAQGESIKSYFTAEMLKISFRVTAKVRGLDPNKDEPPQLKAWFARNKGTKRRKLSDRDRRKRQQNMAKMRTARQSTAAPISGMLN